MTAKFVMDVCHIYSNTDPELWKPPGPIKAAAEVKEPFSCKKVSLTKFISTTILWKFQQIYYDQNFPGLEVDEERQ